MALSGVRILDLTIMTAGPVGTMLLADLGADVIKVEELKEGDLSRNIGRIFLNGESVQFMSANRNKRSVRLDLKNPKGREVFMRLAGTADVICENFRAGIVDRLGVGYEAVKEVNPSIIYASVSAFGQDGPYAHRPANDPIVQALGGVMACTGEEDGEPMRLGYPYPDFGAAALLAYGVCAALLHKRRTGEGQRIELSLLDGVIFSSIPRDGETLASGQAPQRKGSAHGSMAPYQNFRGSDGSYFFLACFTQKLWKRLCEAMQEPGWENDPKFLNNSQRVINQAELAARLQAHFSQNTTDHWVAHLEKFEVPAARVQDLHEALRNDPQVRHNKAVITMEHARAGQIELLSNPVKFRSTPAQYVTPPPVLGEHTLSVLQEFEFSADEIHSLLEDKVVAGPVWGADR